MNSWILTARQSIVWWIDVRTRKHIDDLRLSADGRQDADPNNQIEPCTVDITYEPFLTAILNSDDFGHEVFPYDWRKPLALSASGLKDMVLRQYEANGNQPVHLVAHSMGGLLVRTALMEYGGDLWPRLGRIVFIGTPHYGSPAIAGYLKNHLWGFDLMDVLGLYLSRDTYRSLWGVLELLPADRRVYPETRTGSGRWGGASGRVDPSYDHPCANFDMYQAEDWKLDLSSAATLDLQKVLSGVKGFHKRLYDAHRAMNQELRDRMLVIAGVGFKTLFRLEYKEAFWGLWEHTEKVIERVKGDPHREGDGRVPLASATLENVPIRFIKGVHGSLTNIPAVYGDVFRWLRKEPLRLPDSVEGALSEHLAADMMISELPHLDGSYRARPSAEDPGYWDFGVPSEAELVTLNARIEKGLVPEFITVRLM